MKDTKNDKFDKYREKIISILSTALTTENYSNYASDALSAVIMTLHEVYESTDEYKGREYDKSIEDEILNKLGFASDLIIESLAVKIEQISSVDAIVEPMLGTEDASKPKKLEVALFILASEFGVDFHDQNQFEIRRGYLLPNQDRTEPYCIVTSPVVNVTMLVCNDHNSDIYVLDNKKLRENKIFSEQIYQMSSSEDEIKNLIESIIGVGVTLPATKQLAPQLMSAIKAAIYSDLENYEMPKYDKSHDVCLLKNKTIQEMPEGYVFLFDFASSLGLSQKAMRKLLDSVAEEMGEIKLYKLYIGSVQPCLSIEQQNILKGIYDNLALIPQGYMSVAGFISNLGIDEQTYSKMLSSYTEYFGPILEYRLNSGGIDQCLNPKQQEILKDIYNKYPQMPADFTPIDTLAKQISINESALRKKIKNIDNFGEMNFYRLPIGRIQECLSTEQVKLVSKEDESTKLPKGYMSLSLFAKNLGISEDGLTQIIISNADKLGAISKYEVDLGKLESCLSSEQQEIIRTSYESFPAMPDGFQPVSIFAASGSHDKAVVDRMIEALDGHMGEIKLYKTNTGKIENCLSTEQQKTLADLLKL